MKSSTKEKQNRAIIAKLKSQTGASITFALLLFLVCAALSAIVLVAATTAAGRMSGLAQSDQRYYSVVSAAELMRDLMDGVSVSSFDIGNNHYVFDKPMNEVTNSDVSLEDDIAADTDEADTDSDENNNNNNNSNDSSQGAGISITQTLALKKIRGEIADICINKENGKTITISSDQFELGATITCNVDEYGTVTFTIDNGGDTILMVFSSDINDVRPPVTYGGDSVSNAHEVKWHLTKMVSANDAVTD